MPMPIITASPHCSSKYGAPMGRVSDKIDPDFAGQVKLARLGWQDGCYDLGGAYWGSGGNIWAACWDDETDGVVAYAYYRAWSYNDAVVQVLEDMPHADVVRAVNVVKKRSN